MADPCRFMGGKPMKKKQDKPIETFNQVSPRDFNRGLVLSGKRRKRTYHATKVREFMRDVGDRTYASNLRQSRFKFYS